MLRFYIDWEQKIYIFFKKEIKHHIEVVCRIAERIKCDKQRKKKTTHTQRVNRFITGIKHRELWSLMTFIIPSWAPEVVLWPCMVKQTARCGVLKSNSQTPWKEYCLILHQFSPCRFQNIVFPVIYWFLLHIRITC